MSVVPGLLSEFGYLVVVFELFMQLVFINYCSLALLTYLVKVLRHDIGVVLTNLCALPAQFHPIWEVS